MPPEIENYHQQLSASDKDICDKLYAVITKNLNATESKIWHAHPVWFIDGNPIVGYSKLKNCIRVLFWSGQSFDEEGLAPEGKFKAAEARYTAPGDVNVNDLKRWLEKAEKIQWDYKNLVKRKGKLERLR